VPAVAPNQKPLPLYINGRFYAQRLSGVQRYGAEIVRALDELVTRDSDSPPTTLLIPAGVEPPALRNIVVRAVGPGRGHLWTQTALAWAARDGILLSLAASGPLLHRRHLVVIHDAAIFRHPEFYSRSYVAFHRVTNEALARVAKIATVSSFPQQELAAALRLPQQDILVAPNGAEHLRIAPDRHVLERLDLIGRKFFLALGSLTPNKNLAAAVRALARLNRPDVLLIAVGDLDRGVFAATMPEGADQVMLAGRRSDAEIAGLMQSAQALVFPSIYEGFGIPPLEAMVHGCPVLASTAPAVKEVCGDAALYFDPHDDRHLSQLMAEVLDQDAAWHEALRARGQDRITHYSWSASAQVLLSGCRALAAQQGTTI